MTTAQTGTGSGGLTADDRLLRATAREFAQREIAPSAIERDEQEGRHGRRPVLDRAKPGA